MAKFNPYQVITDTLIASIEAGTPAWRCGWTKLGGVLTRPVSGSTGKHYSGVNVLMLWFSAMEQGFHSDVWHTYKGAASKNGQVRKGSKGTKVLRWVVSEKREKGKPIIGSDGEPETYGFMKQYTVFNACQIEWEEGSEYAPPPPPKVEDHDGSQAGDNFEDAKVILDAWATEVDIRHGGDSAFYRPADDFIQLPLFEQFHDEGEYFSTAFHEAVHSTGHKSRLNRFKREHDGDFKKDYAFEELVAELGAAFLCCDAGISQSEQPRPDHAAYLGHWLKVLKDDPKAIVRAASRADKAAKLVLAKAAEADQQMAAK